MCQQLCGGTIRSHTSQAELTDTLVDELLRTLSQHHSSWNEASIGTTAKEIFDLIPKTNGELPFVLIIDTALERGEPRRPGTTAAFWPN